MILGVGCDIIEISRIEKAMSKKNFLRHCFTEIEIEYFEKKNNRAESIAAGFAAKEAVSKALGMGISGFSLKDIEIIHEENGRPYVNLKNNAKRIADELLAKVSISMSHSDTMAMAYAVLDSCKN